MHHRIAKSCESKEKQNSNVQVKFSSKTTRYGEGGVGDMALEWQHQFLFKFWSHPHALNPPLVFRETMGLTVVLSRNICLTVILIVFSG